MSCSCPAAPHMSTWRPLCGHCAAGGRAAADPCTRSRNAQMFALLAQTQQLSFLGGNGVDGGQGAADYIYGTRAHARSRSPLIALSPTA